MSLVQQQQLLMGAGGPYLEVGKYGGAQGEIQGLNRDKNLLMSEVVRLRQQQKSTQQEINLLLQRLHTTERRQQQMMAFLAKAMQNPTFMAQLVQKNEQMKHLQTLSKKRRLPSAGSSNVEESGLLSTPALEIPDGGQLPEYNADSCDVIEELEAFLHEMGENQSKEEAEGQLTEVQQDVRKVAIAQQQQWHQSSQLERGKGKLVAQNVVKLEIPDGIEHLSGTTALDGTETYAPDVNDVFWKELMSAQKEVAAPNSGMGGEANNMILPVGSTSAAPSVAALQISKLWETKPDIDDITKEIGHLGSSP